MTPTHIRWLRICYWTGALLDASATVQMLWPRLFGLMYGVPDFHPGPDYRFAMGMGASLMAGWTALLLWADRRPVERRGILLITIVPVVAGLAANELAGVQASFVDATLVAPIWVLQAGLATLYILVYLRTRPEA